MITGGISDLGPLSPAISRERDVMQQRNVPDGQEEAAMAQQGLPIPPGLGYLIQLQKNIQSAGAMGQMPTTSVAQDLMATNNQINMANSRPAQSPIMPQRPPAVMAPTQEQSMNQEGVASLPAPNIKMAKGGIVAFSGEDGSYVEDWQGYKPFRVVDEDQKDQRTPFGASKDNTKPAPKAAPAPRSKQPNTEESNYARYLDMAKKYIPEMPGPVPPGYASPEEALSGIEALNARKGGVNDMNAALAEQARQFYDKNKAQERYDMYQAAARGFAGGIGYGHSFWQGAGKGLRGALENRADVRDKYKAIDKAYQDGEILRKQALIAQAAGRNEEAAKLYQQSQQLKYTAQVNNNKALHEREVAVANLARNMATDNQADRRLARQDARYDETTNHQIYLLNEKIMAAYQNGDTAEVERLEKLREKIDPTLAIRQAGTNNARTQAISKVVNDTFKATPWVRSTLGRNYRNAMNMTGPEQSAALKKVMAEAKPYVTQIKTLLQSYPDVTEDQILGMVLGAGPAASLDNFGP